MGGDSAGDVDAYRADLAFASGALLAVVKATPDTGESRNTAGANAVDSAEADEGFFHHADEVDGAKASATRIVEPTKIEDGVADELARAMVGDVAASIDFVKGDTAAGEQLVGREDVGAAGIAAEGENRRVFEKEKGVFDETFETQSCDFCLELQRVVVAYASEI